MKYYKHHIGDFDQSTRHLTRIERSIYRDLIELYYDTEQVLPDDIDYLCRKVIARSDEERTCVEQVLNEFFTKVPAGWYHDRCEEEIEAFRNNQSKRSEAGKASAEARKQRKEKALSKRSTHVEQTSNKRATNRKPLTTNHKPFIEEENTSSPSNIPPEPEEEAKSLPKTFRESPYRDEAYEFADWFRTITTETVKFDRDAWAQVWDQLRRVDRRKDVEEMKLAIQRARADPFWSTNFYSPLKLRKRNDDGVMYIDVFIEKMKPKQQNHAADTMQDGNPHAKANAAAIQALQRGRVAESPAGVGNRSG